MIALDVQVLLGLLLYGSLSPFTAQAMSDFGAAMRDPVLRFWAVEHFTMMLSAAVLVHVGRVLARKTASAEQKRKRLLICFGLGAAADARRDTVAGHGQRPRRCSGSDRLATSSRRAEQRCAASERTGSGMISSSSRASPSSRGLGRGPFKAKTRVRIPVGTPPDVENLRVKQSGERALAVAAAIVFVAIGVNVTRPVKQRRIRSAARCVGSSASTSSPRAGERQSARRARVRRVDARGRRCARSTRRRSGSLRRIRVSRVLRRLQQPGELAAGRDRRDDRPVRSCSTVASRALAVAPA